MSKQGLSAACVALTLAFAAGCGDDSQDVDPSRSLAAGVQRAQAAQQAAAATAATGPNRPPVIASLSFSPAQPVSEGQLEARVAASDPDGNLVQFNFRWLVNGRTVQEGARPTVQLPKLERGDSVEVVVHANDGTLESEEKRLSARFENRPPEITFLYVTPQNKKIRRGDVLTAVPEASDPENDHLEFSYSWKVNGTELGHDRQFDTKNLHRGDKIVLQVVANDGFRESYPRALDPIVLVNSAPEIKQLPTLQRQGAQLRYQFEAEDAEGDKNLRFFLQDAPEGMEIDAFSGLLTWEPTPEQVGKHLVKVCVKDSEGDASAFPWEVNVTAEAAPASSASE